MTHVVWICVLPDGGRPSQPCPVGWLRSWLSGTTLGTRRSTSCGETKPDTTCFRATLTDPMVNGQQCVRCLSCIAFCSWKAGRLADWEDSWERASKLMAIPKGREVVAAFDASAATATAVLRPPLDHQEGDQEERPPQSDPAGQSSQGRCEHRPPAAATCPLPIWPRLAVT